MPAASLDRGIFAGNCRESRVFAWTISQGASGNRKLI
jgi:hypothetical protein